MSESGHFPVMREEILSFLPRSLARERRLLDVTAGGGGHFFSILETAPEWKGLCFDRDPLARERISKEAARRKWESRVEFRQQPFSEGPAARDGNFDFILADLGISSFQIDDPRRGLSLHAAVAPDFRMDPDSGPDFRSWLKKTTERELEEIFSDYGEEPKARRLAKAMKSWGPDAFESAMELASRIAGALAYRGSRVHPATRAFQALRIAINDELGELDRLLEWAPPRLAPGGRLAVISFHSLEDRLVKKAFRSLAATEDFVILTKKPLIPGDAETSINPRSRSAKLRLLERRGESS